MPVVTGIDVLGIQRYVFASNRLRDVLSASWMVDRVTSMAAFEEMGWVPDRVLLSAGGNATVEFDTLDDAKRWTTQYTHWLHREAPGLDVVVRHQRGRLARALRILQIDLARAKSERCPSTPQLGLSVTASCSITGLPAVAVNDGELVSEQIVRLRAKRNEAKERWNDFMPTLPHLPDRDFEFPDELDLMGRTHGETSLLGFVHVDGNSVGESISRWLVRCDDSGLDDATVRSQLREWSDAIDRLGKAVLSAVVKRVSERISKDTDTRDRDHVLTGTPEHLGFRLSEWGTKVFLPIRPILLGGDDLTFACDGRIALDLAVHAQREFGRHAIPHLGDEGGMKNLTACAGVALVPPHAPFQRSYELSEALCQSAKRGRQKSIQSGSGATGGWLDWHTGSTRPGESIDEMRKRQYRPGAHVLTMRPYPVDVSDDVRSWNWLENELLGPGKDANNSFRGFRATSKGERLPNAWSGSRSRVKRLATVVSDGPDEVKRQVEAWAATDSELAFPKELGNGFLSSETPLLDALELVDLHLRLEQDQQSNGCPPDTITASNAGKGG